MGLFDKLSEHFRHNVIGGMVDATKAGERIAPKEPGVIRTVVLVASMKAGAAKGALDAINPMEIAKSLSMSDKERAEREKRLDQNLEP